MIDNSMMNDIKENKKYQAISLYAGAGGCSLGFTQQGVNILAAYDICQEAVDTYNLNFDGHKCHREDLSICDFRALRNELNLQKGDLDLVIGGPPCQGFTTAGKRDKEDPRNMLVENYVRALEEFYPRWFMMENVEGILTTAGGNFLIDCVKGIISIGYTLCIKKVYMQEYGVPQRRKRVILVGNREGKRFHFPKPDNLATGRIYKNGGVTLREAISDLEGHDCETINHIRRWEDGIKLRRISMLREGQTMKDLPRDLQHASFVQRSSRRVCDGMPSEKRGGAPSGLKRLIYDEPSLTITGSSTTEFIHPLEDRMLTIRECARIQTFPDTFIFVGSNSQQEQQIGNAIPPLFARRMAEQIFLEDTANVAGELPCGLAYYDVSKSAAHSPALDATCKRLNQYLIQYSLF